MQNDFQPIHLKEANADLDKLIASYKRYKKIIPAQNLKDENAKTSLWHRFLGLFKTSPFELPEDLYKDK